MAKNEPHTPQPTVSARRNPMRVAAWSSLRCPSRPNAEPSPLRDWEREAVTVSSVDDGGRTMVGLAQIVTVTPLNGSPQSPVNRVRLSSYPQLVHRPTHSIAIA